jgi:hypothetical protein
MTGRATTRRAGEPAGGQASRRRSRSAAILIAALLLALGAVWLQACNRSGDTGGAGGTTSSTSKQSSQSGNIEGVLGEKISVGNAVITVRALQSTFQPAMPAQRLSESTPSAPGVGESFYQAYVRVENVEVNPLRVDPADFLCAIGDKVVSIEPTRSGPYARSLLKNTSLDLLLTFEGPAGFQPVLMYKPTWYDGVISIGPKVDQVEEETTTTT